MPNRFFKLIEPLLPDLHRWCRAAVRDTVEAEDVLHEALLKALTRFERYAEGTSFRAFVFTFVAHETLNRNRAILRRQSRERPLDEAATEDLALAAQEHVLHDQVLQDPRSVLEQCEDPVREAFRELRVEDQVVFLLRSVAGLTCREVADALEVPLGTVLGTLYRVRMKLRRRLLAVAKERGLLMKERLS